MPKISDSLKEDLKKIEDLVGPDVANQIDTLLSTVVPDPCDAPPVKPMNVDITSDPTCAPVITPNEDLLKEQQVALTATSVKLKKLISDPYFPILASDGEIDKITKSTIECEKGCMVKINEVIEQTRKDEIIAMAEFQKITTHVDYAKTFYYTIPLLGYYIYLTSYHNKKYADEIDETILNKLKSIKKELFARKLFFYSPIATQIQNDLEATLDNYINIVQSSKFSIKNAYDASKRQGITLVYNDGLDDFVEMIKGLEDDPLFAGKLHETLETIYDDRYDAKNIIENEFIRYKGIIRNYNTNINSVLQQVTTRLNTVIESIGSSASITNKTGPAIEDLKLQNFGFYVTHDITIASGNPKEGLLKRYHTTVTRQPGSGEAATGLYTENLFNEIKIFNIGNIKQTMANVDSKVHDISLCLAAILIKDTSLNLASSKVDDLLDRIVAAYKSLLNTYEINDITYKKHKIIERLTPIRCCGQPVINPNQDIFATAVNTSTNDINWRTFEEKGQPQMTELKYWKIYSALLNTVALNPAYWSIGMIVAGPVSIPLPVVWLPLVVIKTPNLFTVVFLTINGLVVTPCVWQLRLKPIADCDSYHTTLFRGANIYIKTRTYSRTTGAFIKDNIDTSPTGSFSEAFIEDPLPTVERIRPSNAALLLYMSLWCSTARPYMGLT